MEALFSDIDEIFLLEWALLWAIMGVGCYTIYTDVCFREIGNGATWGLLGLGLVGQVGFWALGKTDWADIGLVAGAGLGVSFLLFLYGFWAPGDAKLFWAVVVAVPPTLFRPIPFFSFHTPLWSLLLHALLLNGILLVGIMVFQRRWRALRVQEGWQWTKWLRSGVELAGLSGLVLSLGPVLTGQPLPFVAAVVAVLVLYLLFDRFVPPDYRLVFVLPGVIMGLYEAFVSQVGLLYGTLWLFTWIVQTIYQMIYQRYGPAFQQMLPIPALRVGMTPRAAICAVAGNGGHQVAYTCTEHVSPGQDVVCYPNRPLNTVTLRRLRQLAAQGEFRRFGNRLEVELNMPFAPAIVGSVILTTVG